MVKAADTPDFAFPKKVEASAQSDLERACASSDGPGIVNATIRWGLAKAAVSSDSLECVLRQIDSVLHLEQTPVAAKSMLQLLQAKIYTDIYTANSRTYQQRTSPVDGDVAADYRLWNRMQFLEKVDSLTTCALADREMLLAIPISEYALCIDIERSATTFYPTLYDFIASRAISYLRVFDNNSAVLSAALAENLLDESLYLNTAGAPTGRILSIYRNLIVGRELTPSGILARRNMLDYVVPRIFRADAANRYAVPSFLREPDNFTYDVYRNAYNECSASPYAIELLLTQTPQGDTERKEYYNLLAAFSHDNPDYFNINGVRNRIGELAQRGVDVNYPCQFPKGKPMTVTVKSKNVTSAVLKVYRLPDATARESWQHVPGSKPVATYPLQFDGTVPFSSAGTVMVTLPEYGLYIIVPEFEGMNSNKGRTYRVIGCSDLAAGAFVHSEGAMATIADAWTGKPVAGASLSFSSWSRKSAGTPISGSTDANGLLSFRLKDGGAVAAALGADRFAEPIRIHPLTPSDTATSYMANVQTSLGMYRPGDSMDFAIVVTQSQRDKGVSAAAGCPITVELLDANFQRVATQNFATDGWGRVGGSFTLPSAGLTGNFTLRVLRSDSYIGSGSFMVSDYKLPTFEVTIDSVKRPATPSESAWIYGRATTFAGFPVGDSEVTAQVKVRSGFWIWAATSPVFYETKVQTDAHGSFAVEIPASAIAASPAPRGFFLADVSVTSADGETHQAQASFNLGKPYFIRTDIPNVFVLGSSKAEIQLLDYNGKEATTELRYTIYRQTRHPAGASCVETDGAIMDEEILGSGSGEYNVVREGAIPAAGSITDIVAALPQGRYLMAVSAADTAMADTAYSSEFTVYDPESTESPVDEMLWLPETTVVADDEGHATVRFATSLKGADILVAVSGEDGKLLRTYWIKGVSGQHKEVVTLPDVSSRCRVYLRVAGCARSVSASVTILPSDSKKSIKISTETFRDKVVPLSQETITFRVSGENGASCGSAVMLDMANRAIDVLAPNPFRFSAPTLPFRGIYVNGWNFPDENTSIYQPFKHLKQIQAATPFLRLYGRTFLGRTMMFDSTVRLYNASASRKMKTTRAVDMVEEIAVADEVAELAEEAVTTGDVDNAAGADGGNVDDASVENFRPSEIPLAFFHPMLATERDGSLSVSYTVPDANTSWILRAMAYNSELLSATTSAEIVSSRPLMVSANAPRFLRTADSIVLQASVMNDTDSTVVANTTMQLLNAADMTEVASVAFTDTIAPVGRKVVALPFTVSEALTGVILRVKSSAGAYSDGEQILIPVIPSAQDVTESQMFYLAPNQAHFNMQIEPVGEGGRAYLDYTENPAWQVVSALPGLRQNRIDSSIEAAAALFSAAIADGLMSRYPEVARALRRWSSNPADSALVSALEKNAQLKSILLSDTPWVGQALNQTQRMQRLVLLLDKNNTEKVVADAVNRLAQCYVSGGGWCWTKSYPEASMWATEEILDMLGGLNRLGFLPRNERLDDMIKGSLRWLDASAAQQFAKYPDSEFTTYAFVRVKFPEIKASTAAHKVMNATVRRILSGWRSHSVVLKGADAIILNGNGYNASARQILQSLRELSTSTPERGMWWQQLENECFFSRDKVGCTGILLDAFALVEPHCADIDKIRQWLVLGKMNTDWGNAIITSQVVSSILTSGTDWAVNPRTTAIRVGSELIEPSETEAYTGAFVEPVGHLVASGATLTIDRQANYPSFGAVVTMRHLPMSDIEAKGCEDLRVEKRLSVMRGGRWVVSDRFMAGDRVRVTLTVYADADMDYVVIQDARAAAFEPVEQLPTPIWSERLCFYRENRDTQTNLFIDRLPRGVYVLDYELFATQNGTFASGVAQAQSHYNPAIAAHSGGAVVTVSPK